MKLLSGLFAAGLLVSGLAHAEPMIEGELVILNADQRDATVNLGVPGASVTQILELEANRRYVITVRADADNANGDPQIFLSTEENAMISSNDNFQPEDLSAGLVFVPARTGRYQLVIRDGFGSVGNVTSYLYDMGAVTVTKVTMGEDVAGSIEVLGDRQVFEVDMVAGKYYELSMLGENDMDTVLTLYGPDQAAAAWNDDHGASLSSMIQYWPTVSGTYRLEAAGYGDVTVGRFVIRVEEHNSFADKLPAIAVGGVNYGTVVEGSGNGNLYAVELEAGKNYSFTLTGCVGANGEPVLVCSESPGIQDPFLVLRGEDLSVITYNDDRSETDLNSAFEAQVPSSGKYILQVFNYTGYEMNYSLLVQEAGQ